MKIKVLTFGIARDITGVDTLELVVPPGTTVEALKEHLNEQYPAFKRLNALRLAVNATYSEQGTVLGENDEIAIIPPVSGG